MMPSCIDQFISQLFLVEKKEKSSFIPVINFKPLNTFIQKEHFKMDGAGTIKDLLQPRDWICSLDLKDGYLAVPIAKEHCKYLCFLWNGRIFEFTCLPFGLCSAPRVFTKLLHSVMAYLRSQGLRTIIYLDDILLMHQAKTTLCQEVQRICNLLEVLGFTINHPKSQTVPAQRINSWDYSGFQSDEVAASSREARQHCTDLPEPEETITGFSLSTARENDSGSPSSSLSSNTILTLTTAENTIIETLQIIQSIGYPKQGVNGGTLMVVETTSDVEWQRHSPTTPRSCDRNGRLPSRLRSCMSRSADRGAVVSGRTTGAHQCTGADCRDVCCTGLREGQEECSHPPQDGQYICPSLCDQDGGNSIHQTNSSGMPDLRLVSSETINPLSITFTGLG